MAELKINIPEDIRREVERNTNINWSEVVGRAIKEELGERAERKLILTALNKILENSKLTEEEALKLGERMKESIWRIYQEKGW